MILHRQLHLIYSTLSATGSPCMMTVARIQHSPEPCFGLARSNALLRLPVRLPEMWRTAITAEINSGVARKAPIGPHIHAQKAIDRNTKNGFSVSRWPMIVGVKT